MTHTTEQLEAMLAAATPGPWTVRKWAQAMTITGNVHQVVSEENYPTAFVPAWDDPGPGEIDGTDEAKANAALIAAAPTITAELIAARKRIASLEDALVGIKRAGGARMLSYGDEHSYYYHTAHAALGATP